MWFARFPRNADLKQRWVVKVGRQQSDGTLWQPSVTSCLCSRHFHESDFEIQFGQKKLKSDAIPTIFSHRPKQHKRKAPKDRLPPVTKRLCTTSEIWDSSINQQDHESRYISDDHNYALLSPRKMLLKLRHVGRLAAIYKRKLHNSRRRENKLRGKIEDLVEQLRQHALLSTKAEELIQTYSGNSEDL